MKGGLLFSGQFKPIIFTKDLVAEMGIGGMGLTKVASNFNNKINGSNSPRISGSLHSP